MAATPTASASAAGGSAPSGLGGAGATAGYVAALVAAQEAMMNNTDTTFEGVKSDGFFHQDENGQWEPHAFTEPWMAFGGDKLGFKDPSPGEKMDAAIQNSDWEKVARRIPSTANQWANPIGDFAARGVKNFAEKGLGKTGGRLAHAAVDPIGAVSDLVDDSFLCSETARQAGLAFSEIKALIRLRRWVDESPNQLSRHYFTIGSQLVKEIAKQEDLKAFYKELKADLIEPVVAFVSKKDYQSAYDHYAAKYLSLLKKYAIHLYPGYAKLEMPEAL